MSILAAVLTFSFTLINVLNCEKTAGYYEYKNSLQRNLLQEKEREFSQNHVVLNEDETIVNNYLEHLKNEEFQATRDNFLPSKPIERVMTQIKSSNIYRVLKKFPKGGNMHLHLNHILSKEKMLDLIFHSPLLDNLCVNTQSGDDQWQLMFFQTPPTGWVKVVSDPALYSRDQLLKHLTLLNVLDDNAKANPTDSNIRWQQMGPLFSLAGWSLVDYANYTRMHLKAIFEAAKEENVQYLEARASGPELYVVNDSSSDGHGYIDNDDGDLWNSILREEIDNFKRANTEFIGFREIINGKRYKTHQQVKDALDKAIRLRQKYPDIVGGFDLVAEEDKGYSLLFFMEEFAEIEANKNDIPLYFHTAETNWPDDLLTSIHSDDPVSTLENVYEAIILGAKRLGHGLGFIKHPYLMQVIKDKKIAVEANPVSNMLLGYVTDQRHHPAITYLRYGIPVVLGADDPGTMGYDEFTVDWYEAFMGWGLNLADLKQLAMNSLTYSTMSKVEKTIAFQKWNMAYDDFISNMKKEACQTNTYPVQPDFHSIYPSEGSLMTSTKIRVFGRNFESAICRNITCHFGNFTSPGHYAYDSMITCDSPPVHGSAITVPLFISFISGVDMYKTNLTFSYEHMLQSTDSEVTSFIIG